MTTGELKALLETCPEDTEIIIVYETYARRAIDTVAYEGERLMITAENHF